MPAPPDATRSGPVCQSRQRAPAAGKQEFVPARADEESRVAAATQDPSETGNQAVFRVFRSVR